MAFHGLSPFCVIRDFYPLDRPVMLPSYHHVDALSILEIHLFLWISTSDAVLLDQAMLPEPDGALEARGESPFAPGIPHVRRHRVCVDAKPAAICVTSPYARSRCDGG